MEKYVNKIIKYSGLYQTKIQQEKKIHEKKQKIQQLKYQINISDKKLNKKMDLYETANELHENLIYYRSKKN